MTHNVWGMRRFACRNFQFTTKLNSKLSYTPCYMQCGNISLNLNRRTEPFCFIFVGGNLKFEYLKVSQNKVKNDLLIPIMTHYAKLKGKNIIQFVGDDYNH